MLMCTVLVYITYMEMLNKIFCVICKIDSPGYFLYELLCEILTFLYSYIENKVACRGSQEVGHRLFVKHFSLW